MFAAGDRVEIIAGEWRGYHGTVAYIIGTFGDPVVCVDLDAGAKLCFLGSELKRDAIKGGS